MLEILKKYQELPQDLRARASDPAVLACVNELEQKYNLSLSLFMMGFLAYNLKLEDLEKYLISELKLAPEKSLELAKELKEKVLQKILNFQEKNISKPEPIAVSEKLEIKSEIKPKIENFIQEDEAEIAKIKEEGPIPNLISENIDETVEKIFSELEMSFGSQLLVDRLKNIIKTVLLGVRDQINTKEALLKPFKDGGVNLASDDAQKVLNILAKYQKNNFNNKENNNLSEALPKIKPMPRDVEYNLAQAIEKIKQKKAEPEKSKNQQVKADSEKITIKPEAKNNLSYKLNRFLNKEKRLEIKKNNTSLTGLNLNQRPEIPDDFGKENMDGIKQAPKTMSPINELRYMSLVDFRRLHREADQAIIKIKQKIDLLSDYGYAQKIAGIKAWRESPVNRLYLRIGQESIMSGKSTEQIIQELAEKEENVLTQAEFDSISELNKELRF